MVSAMTMSETANVPFCDPKNVTPSGQPTSAASGWKNSILAIAP